jgi:hypothetical protein
MKYLCMAALGLLILAGVATAETDMGFMGAGVRAGFRLDPDQFLVGGQLDLGEFTTNLRFMPNASIGFGDYLTLISINPEVHYLFKDAPIADGTWFYAGGGLDLLYAKIDNVPEPFDDSDTTLGFSITGGIERQMSDSQSLMGEIRMVFEDDSFFEIVGAWNFGR